MNNQQSTDELQGHLIAETTQKITLCLNKELLKIQKKYRKHPDLVDMLATVNINTNAVALGTAIASTCHHIGTGREGGAAMLESMMLVAQNVMNDAFNLIKEQGFEPNEPLEVKRDHGLN